MRHELHKNKSSRSAPPESFVRADARAGAPPCLPGEAFFKCTILRGRGPATVDVVEQVRPRSILVRDLVYKKTQADRTFSNVSLDDYRFEDLYNFLPGMILHQIAKV